MLGALVRSRGDEMMCERLLDADEPFLSDHRMGTTPILPAVIALESFFELAHAAAGCRARIKEAEILTPMKVPEEGALLVRHWRRGEALWLTATPRRQDGVTLEPDRAFVRGRFEPAPPTTPMVRPRPAGRPLSELPHRYPYPPEPDRTPGSHVIFHGETFRTLRGVLSAGPGGLAILDVPSPRAAFEGAPGTPWLPVAVLDGCLQAAGLLARLRFEVVALPARFEDVVVLPENAAEPGMQAILQIEGMTRTDDRVRCRLVLYGEDGPWVVIRTYEAQCVPDPAAGIVSAARRPA